jgi:hypothetical protein
MSRYHLPYTLEALGFIATPFSFYHPQHDIVITHKLKRKAPWTVEVRGELLTYENGGCLAPGWMREYKAGRALPRVRRTSQRAYRNVEEAAQAGLRACGAGRRRYDAAMKLGRTAEQIATGWRNGSENARRLMGWKLAHAPVKVDKRKRMRGKVKTT